MPKFNLQDYEPVEERLERFHKDYKEGRVITEMVGYTDERVVFKASLYRNFNEEKPWATGYAEETRGQGGIVNDTSHLENCETSAIGRALANAGYAPKGQRPSREEMAKVNNQHRAITRQSVVATSNDVSTDALRQIKRLYAVTAKLHPEAQNIGQRITQMIVAKGFKSLSVMPVSEIKAMADQLESKVTNSLIAH